jgi:hypothetical protein
VRVTRNGTRTPYTEWWNGSTWNAAAVAPPQTTAAALSGVSCASATACLAVGWAQPAAGGARVPLIETWDGTSWSVTAGSARPGSLSAVSCITASSCVAVGSFPGETSPRGLVLTLNSGVAAVFTPPAAASGPLVAVACRASGTCLATGAAGAPWETPSPLAITGSGSQWRAVNALPAGDLGATLSGAACDDTNCTAVGGWLDSGGQLHTLAERSVG